MDEILREACWPNKVNVEDGITLKSKYKKIGGYNVVTDVVYQALRLHLCAEDRCKCSDSICPPMNMQKSMEGDVADVVLFTKKANRMCYPMGLKILN